MVRIFTKSGNAAVTEAEVTLDYHPIFIRFFNDDATNAITFQCGEEVGDNGIQVAAEEDTGWLECPSNKTIHVKAAAGTPAYRITYKTM